MQRRHRLVLGLATLLTVAAGLVVSPGQAEAATAQNAYEQDIFVETNQARAAAGLAALTAQPGLTDLARNWAADLSRRNQLQHNPKLGDDLPYYGSPDWREAAENVGVGGSAPRVFAAYMASAGHKANILRRSVGQVGVGAVRGPDGRIWDVMVFTDSYNPVYGASRTNPGTIAADGSGAPVVPPAPPAPRPPAPQPAPAPAPAHFFLSASFGAGATNHIAYGTRGDVQLTCDWDGNGTDTIGIFRRGTWYLRNTNSPGGSDIVVGFGNPTDQPVCGDWNGNGTDTLGLFRNGRFFLSNSNTRPSVAGTFLYGTTGDVALAGDWNGDRFDTVGVQRANGRFYLTDSNVRPVTNYGFGFGNSTDKAVVGDWDGNGRATLAVVRNGIWFLSNSNTRVQADRIVRFGNPTDRPLAGHWAGAGRADSIGVGRIS